MPGGRPTGSVNVRRVCGMMSLHRVCEMTMNFPVDWKVFGPHIVELFEKHCALPEWPVATASVYAVEPQVEEPPTTPQTDSASTPDIEGPPTPGTTDPAVYADRTSAWCLVM